MRTQHHLPYLPASLRSRAMTFAAVTVLVIGIAVAGLMMTGLGKPHQAQAQSAPPVKLSSPRPGSVVKAQYGDWKHECTKPPGAPRDLCAITQDVTDETNDEIGLSVHVQKLPTGERILRVIAPLGVLLTHNLAVKVDGNLLGEAPFSRCYVLGCQAQIDIDDKFFKQLTTGKTLLLIVHRTSEQGIGIPISLNGFVKGFAALKYRPRPPLPSEQHPS